MCSPPWDPAHTHIHTALLSVSASPHVDRSPVDKSAAYFVLNPEHSLPFRPAEKEEVAKALAIDDDPKGEATARKLIKSFSTSYDAPLVVPGGARPRRTTHAHVLRG